MCCASGLQPGELAHHLGSALQQGVAMLCGGGQSVMKRSFAASHDPIQDSDLLVQARKGIAQVPFGMVFILLHRAYLTSNSTAQVSNAFDECVC